MNFNFKKRGTKKNIVLSLSVVMSLVMTINSFAMDEATPAITQVNSDTGAFTVTGGTLGTDYEFTGTTEQDGVLVVHPQNPATQITIKNSNPSTLMRDVTKDRIEVTTEATIVLDGVNIIASSGPALKIPDDASFNVTIILNDGKYNRLFTSASGCAALQKNGNESTGTLTIDAPVGSQGTGDLNPAIYGASKSAGIGGAEGKDGCNIIIKGGNVEAAGADGAAAIGGGFGGNGKNIQLLGGYITAAPSIAGETGGTTGAGVGGGKGGTGSNNVMNGNVIVEAYNSDLSKPGLEGFEGNLNRGLYFTRKGKPQDKIMTGKLYGDIEFTTDYCIPGELTIEAGQTLTVKEGINVRLYNGEREVNLTNKGTLQVNGTLLNEEHGTINGPINCGPNGQVQTYIKYNTGKGGTDQSGFIVYKDATSIKTYSNMYQTTKSDYNFIGWYTEPEGSGQEIKERDPVQCNQHTLYAKWEKTVPDQFKVEGENVLPGVDYRYNGNYALEILSNKKMTISNNPNTGSETTNWRIYTNHEADIVLNGVNINTTYGSALEIEDNAKFNVTITIADGSKNALQTDEGDGGNDAALQKNGDIEGIGRLTIQGETAQTGELIVTNKSLTNAAGIGGGNFKTASNIIIQSGTVIATTEGVSAGIGGGAHGNGNNITISGGVVKATGGTGIGGGIQGNANQIEICGGNVTAISDGTGAGIGGGTRGEANNIIIREGHVIANGGSWAAGIGGGQLGKGSYIYIYGGTVEATSGNGAAAIGGGNALDGSDILIDGGTVIATGKGGAGIGGGSYGNGNRITISGGNVTATSTGEGGAGIGGGYQGIGNDITIKNNCIVKATGAEAGAGIGGGLMKNGENIKILGGVVTANGGLSLRGQALYPGAGIGGGAGGSGSGNILNGNAVVFATSKSVNKNPIEGFDSGLIQGIMFTNQLAQNDDWNGAMYGNVVLSQSVEFPTNLEIGSGQTLTVGKDVDLGIKDSAQLNVKGTLTNEGTITGSIDCQGDGIVTTLVNYDVQGGNTSLESEYKIYRDSNGVKNYETLPDVSKNGYTLSGWYTEKAGTGNLTTVDTLVDLNQHTLYANWKNGTNQNDRNSKTGDPFTGFMALALLGLATTGTFLIRKRK